MKNVLKLIKQFIEDIKKLLKSKDEEQLRLKSSFHTISFVWIFIIILSLSFNLWHESIKTRELVENTARSDFEKDKAFRLWGSSHGGVYVPATKRTPPNSNLAHIPYRDIEKPDGTKLTLMNPAYMVRQIMQDYSGLYDSQGRITSLKYIYEGNKPDEWETRALKSFEKGNKELLEYTQMDNKPFLRLMRPMYVKENCLKCHASQDYKLGDVRGGVGIRLPLQLFYDESQYHSYLIFLGHLLLWFIIYIGILLSMLRESKHIHKNSKIQSNLEENKAMLNEAQRIANIGSWKIDLVSKKLILSDEVYNMIEIDTNKYKLTHKVFFHAIHPDDRNKVSQGYFDSLNQKTPFNMIHRLLMKDGRIKYVKESCETTFDSQGKPLVSIGSIQDITASYLLQNELKVNRELFKNMFEAVPNIMITTDGDEIDKANSAMLEFFSYSTIDAFKSNHKCICDFFIEGDDFIQPVMDGMSWLKYILSKPDVMHKVCMMKDAKTHKFIVSAEPLLFNDNGRSVVTFTDVTELENANLELKKQENIMISQSRNAAMGEMISMIAHQWRQPISVIAMGANNMLVDIELDSLDAETIKKGAQDIVEQTQELSKTINDFRNFFQPERNSENIRPEDIFAKAFNVIGKSLQNNEINVLYDFRNDRHITTYSRELMQVFINILKNATEALIENNIREKKIFLSSQNSEDEITIRICDNAGGIEDDVIDKIFDPYFSTKDEQTGTGLGLYMSKTIIEKHLGGSIKAYNKVDTDGPDIGTCFEISIPISLEEDNNEKT